MWAWLANVKARIDATFWNAVTMAATLFGTVMAHLDDLATLMGDANLNSQLQTVITDAKWFGRWMLLVGVIGAVSRIKSLVTAPPKAP